MQKKTSQNPKPKLLSFSQTESNVASFAPVNRNGWWIKFSVYNQTDILLVFTSMYTGQTIVRYFVDESEAVKLINYIIESDPTEEILN